MTKELTEKQKLYRLRKKLHICVECGVNDAFHRFVRCPECLEKRTNYEHTPKSRAQHYSSAKARIAARLEAGVCVECGGELCKDSKRLCQKHLDAHRAYHNAYERRRRAKLRTKSLEQIAKEKSERGRKNIHFARESPKFLAHIERQKDYWNRKYWDRRAGNDK